MIPFERWLGRGYLLVRRRDGRIRPVGIEGGRLAAIPDYYLADQMENKRGDLFDVPPFTFRKIDCDPEWGEITAMQEGWLARLVWAFMKVYAPLERAYFDALNWLWQHNFLDGDEGSVPTWRNINPLLPFRRKSPTAPTRSKDDAGAVELLERALERWQQESATKYADRNEF